jgi:hypothetical protein
MEVLRHQKKKGEGRSNHSTAALMNASALSSLNCWMQFVRSSGLSRPFPPKGGTMNTSNRRYAINAYYPYDAFLQFAAQSCVFLLRNYAGQVK